MRISIVCPVYKTNPNYLKAALESFIHQKGDFEKELIVVVDPPLEATAALLEEYDGKHNIKVINNEERAGLVASRLKGVKAAKGQYIGFMDGDDYLAENFCEKMIQTIEENNADVADCSFYRVNHKGKAEKDGLRFRNGVFTGHEACGMLIMDISLRGFLWSKVYKREIIESAMDEIDLSKQFGILFEDFPVNFAALSKCEKVVLIKDQLYNYRKAGEASATDQIRSDRAAQHLTAFALSRHYADLSGKEELVKPFKNKWLLFRIKTSLWYDLGISKKGGLTKLEAKEIKAQTKLLSNLEPLPTEGKIWSELLNKTFSE